MNPSNPSPAVLQDVLDVLRDAGFSSAHWRPLGRRLKPDLDLEAIEINHPTVERRLEDVISGWQRDGENSWEKLVEAVSQCKNEGGGRNISQKIRENVGLAIDSEGRQSISSAITPQSPASLFHNRQTQIMFSEKEIEDALESLNGCFNMMVTDTQNALQKSEADPELIVNIIKLKDKRHRYTPPYVFDSLTRAADAVGIFNKLSDYWDYFNYHLLERLFSPEAESLYANHLKSAYHNLRERMTQYKKDMDYFRRYTAIEVYCKVVTQPKENVPPEFRELIRERDDLKTLQDVENFRLEVARKYTLWDFLVFVKRIKIGSVIIALWIPKSAEPVGDMSDAFVDVLSVASSLLVDEVEIEEDTPYGDEPPPPKRLKASEKTQAIEKKKSSVASLILTTVSKVVPKSVADPLVLMNAVSNGDKTQVEDLIVKGADPNAHPLMIQFTPLMEASRLGNVEIAQLLLAKGADPNLTNYEDWTALMAAANNGRYGTVDILLQNGANPDMQDNSGWSALMAAVYKRHNDVALRIIEAGATPHIQDKNHTNALLLAVASNEQEAVVDVLLDHVSRPELDIQDSYGETALIFACKRRNLTLVKRLLSMGANPDICNNYRETPVLIATQFGMEDILEELLENEANPNKGAEPPLLVAIASDLPSEDIVKLLTSHGADINQKDERGVMAFEVAEMRNFTDLAQKLNPQQFSLRTPKEVYRLTLKSLASLQSHINLGPLFLNPETEPGMLSVVGSWLQGMLQRFQVQ